MAKRYNFITRKTGKKANIASVDSRAKARLIKAARWFTVDIYDNVNKKVIR